MVYRAIGLMSGSSLDGLDIAFVEFTESMGKWSYNVEASDCIGYTAEWKEKLAAATKCTAYEYLLLHAAYGKYLGQQVNEFIDKNHLHHRVQLIASHGHTTFHAPHLGMTAQLGDGAALAAETAINVISDLRALDVAFGGQGAPIVPIGEKLLFSDYPFCLNIGGICNISYKKQDSYLAFDVCPANKVLNMLAHQHGKEYDEYGQLAESGNIITPMLTHLNSLPYYAQPYPKSLANSFGIEEVYPVIESYSERAINKLRTYTEHITMQVAYAVQHLVQRPLDTPAKMLVTGGGAFNTFLIKRLSHALQPYNIEIEVPAAQVVNYKEAIVMALIGVLRWREEYNVFNTVTGALRSSIGGAVWIGQEA